ncbi:OadG family protein [bacterium]|nr:OadG family protein [bacterium]MBU1882468.1 OadG family protein [bacterium]
MPNFSAIIAGNGFSLMLVGMLVVFAALVLLMFLMKGLKATIGWFHDRSLKASQESAKGSVSSKKTDDVPAGVIAALALTLILEDEQIHDNESLVLTLHSLSKPYSNWWMNNLQPPWQSWQHRTPRKVKKNG